MTQNMNARTSLQMEPLNLVNSLIDVNLGGRILQGIK
jgi:hypothetical protein